MSIERLDFYAFYGTLRRGMENHLVFAETLVFLKTVDLTGYRMHSLVEYPYVVHTNSPGDHILVDLFRITSFETEQMIYGMEIDAGYILSTIDIDGNKFGIYVFAAEGPGDAYLPDGDWVRHTLGQFF